MPLSSRLLIMWGDQFGAGTLLLLFVCRPLTRPSQRNAVTSKTSSRETSLQLTFGSPLASISCVLVVSSKGESMPSPFQGGYRLSLAVAALPLILLGGFAARL